MNWRFRFKLAFYGSKLQFHQTIIMVNNIYPRMRESEILPCHARMAFLFIILCFSHDLFSWYWFSFNFASFCAMSNRFKGFDRASTVWLDDGKGENKFSAHFPFPADKIIFTFEDTNYAGETLTLNTFLLRQTENLSRKISRCHMPKSGVPRTALFDASSINVMIYSFRPSNMKEWAGQSGRERHKKSIIIRYRYFWNSEDGESK